MKEKVPDQHFCLRWNNYQTNMTSVFHQLLENEDFVDVTLACRNSTVKAHKVVLSACSPYFQKLLLENPCPHPTIIMPQDICYEDLKFIIDFVYKGEIDVTQIELQSLLKTADRLKIKGLSESERDPLLSPTCVTKEHHFVSTNTQKEFGFSNNNKRTFREVEDTNPMYANGVREDFIEGYTINDSDASLDNNEEIPKKQRLVSSKLNNMSNHGLLTEQVLFSQLCDADEFPPEPLAPSATPVGHVDLLENSPTRRLLQSSHRTDLSDVHIKYEDIKKETIVKFETLRSFEQDSMMDMDSTHMPDHDHSIDSQEEMDRTMHSMLIASESMKMVPGSSSRLDTTDEEDNIGKHNGYGEHVNIRTHTGGPKTWTQDDMELALDALRNHSMSLTKASATYGIPSTTLWQRAHRLGIDTPKKEGPTKSWTEESLNCALKALRTGTISANKASKAYGIPSSTLYKIARREGIKLAAPFNAAPTTWSPDDLERALDSIRSGQSSVQKASTEFGIPTGTLYGRCKREGIELSRSNPTPWSEGAMGEALEAVRLGHMSINQAAIHYNLPYSSLYGRFKRGVKYDADVEFINTDSQSQHDAQILVMDYPNSHQQIQYEHCSDS